MTNPTEEVKLPELEVVAWSKVSKEHIPRMRMLNESYVKGVWDVPLVRLSDAQAGIERLKAVIRDHNADCESQCEQRQRIGGPHCPYAKYGRGCPDCPRDGMTDAAIEAARQTTREQP